MSYYVEAIIALCPNNKWRIIDGILEWHDDVELKPTEEQIQSKITELQNNEPMKKLREERNERLSQTDKYFIYDWPHKNDERNEWLLYREQLRNLPSISNPQLENGILTNVNWPVPPY